MTNTSKKYKLRFFFDYGAGGCLWAGNDVTRDDFGSGPVDETIAKHTGKISTETLKEIEELDKLHEDFYNKDYPLDPSLWRQSKCDEFNHRVDKLINDLKQQLSPDFDIEDEQTRYSEDEDLDEYLKYPRNFKRKA